MERHHGAIRDLISNKAPQDPGHTPTRR
jgi:hypothetical protein